MPNWGVVSEPRVGVMLHFDGSASDRGAVQWLKHDPRCKVSYHYLVLDDGPAVEIAPLPARAWHAGVCRSSDATRLPYLDANSAFYGLCVAARPGDTITLGQRDVLVGLCVAMFQREGWPLSDTWRIVEHASEAHPRGRKVDLGQHLVGLTLADVRTRVAEYAQAVAA